MTAPEHLPTPLLCFRHVRRITAMLGLVLACLCSLSGTADAKRKPAQRPQPDLQILSVMASPESYSPQNGSLALTIDIALPKDLDGATLLEVSSLISSPSKRSLRFLSNRQRVGDSAKPTAQTATAESKPQLSVTLTWDGTDQTKQVVENGTYAYEVRAKLLAVGEKGPRTQMTAWPKRGTIKVK